MTPSHVVLIRHAQAEHNVACDWSLKDPPLTELGRKQAHTVPKAYPELFKRTNVVLTSPLRRTIETTLAGFPELTEKKVPLEILPDLQETQAHPCDIGSSKETLQTWFKDDWLDFSHCPDGWWEKTGRYAATEEALDARATHVRRTLKRRKEKVIVVVCHAGFLRHVICAPHSHMWKNVEARVYRFESPEKENPQDPDVDQALLLRLEPEEERDILGGEAGQDILVESY